ncbi:MAG: AmmeMemoRadiSam system protein B [Gemmatimonadetes bacterium]|nr:AmmeMemoRadiSam system protein B [Gemmatimonadota bacterium]
MRAPAVSGRFYPAQREVLERDLRTLLAEAGDPPRRRALAAIVPHAGYVYSGATAARVFAALELPSLVVVLAPNHTGVCRAEGGASLWEAGTFRTPLGDVPIADQFAQALLDAEPLVGVDHEAHRAEHAVEVELPFLQLLRADVRIVPLVLAWDAWEACRALGDSLARVVRRWPEPVLLLASSDLNHYEPASVSEPKDKRALEAVVALDGSELLQRCRRERISMCGRGPAATTLAAATSLGAERAEVVDYRHSGWVSGDYDAVVGYGGVVIT